MTDSRHDRPAPAPEPGPRSTRPGVGNKHPRPAPAPVPGSAADRPSAPVATLATVTAADIWAVLSTVPDPEIPAVTLTDLGMVRGVRHDGRAWVVDLTPTYSGCPATAVIELMASDALRAAGIDARVNRVLSPPWTTAWITDAGRAKLEAHGIAPPDPRGPQRCPRCGGAALERVSQFGSTPCKAQWRCRTCAEPFDVFKCH